MVNDNFLLLSLVNTKLRDTYENLSDLCEEEGYEEEEVLSRLGKIGYFYDEKANAFKPV